ncbi:MAG: metallophosphoesterase, partial [Verrucomicrobiota bacterium]
QIEAFEAATAYVEKDGRPIDAFLHLGDLAYDSGTDQEFEANFFAIYRSLIKNTVVWPTMGNHEGRASNGFLATGPYFDAFVLPSRGEAGGLASGTESYYSFDLGRIHFVCLNSHDVDRSPEAAMALWLKEDLAAMDADWLIAFWHHPPYSKGTHDSDWETQLVEMRENIVPILEDHGVDLLLCGHSHIYERSMLLNGAYQTPSTVQGVVFDDGDGDPEGDGAYVKSAGRSAHSGLVAVVAGHGSSTSRFGTMPLMRRISTSIGSVFLDVDGNQLDLTMVNNAGGVEDRCRLIKQGRQDAAPLDHPWQPRGPDFTMARRGQGVLEVQLFPVPPAPDAEVRYTIDGSDPGLDSLLYTGPIELTGDALIKAMTVWRNRSRVSPVSNTPFLAVSRDRAIEIPVQRPEDDGFEDLEGMVRLTEGVIGPEKEPGGLGEWAAFRFSDLRIPAGSTLSRAYLQFTGGGQDIEDALLTIQAERTADSAPLSEEAGELSKRRRTTNRVQWEPNSWWTGVRSVSQESPDLSVPLQEVVNLPDWKAGNAVTFLFQFLGPGTRRILAREGGGASSASLRVEYETGSIPVSSTARAPVVRTVIDEDGTAYLRVEFLRWKAFEAFGLEYVIETTSDLVGPWESAVAVGEQAADLRGAWERVSSIIAFPPRSERELYLRLKVTGPKDHS